MSKSEGQSAKKEQKNNFNWVITVFLVTILISGTISLVSDEIMAASTMWVAFLILLLIVLIGIVFDIIGVAVTSADEKPFHSMAARKVPGATEALRLLRKAERVSSICNDVIGDICGVVSGAASATIAVQLLDNFTFSWPRLASLLMSAFVAGLTVGGKALGKSFAIKSRTEIVFAVGRVIHGFHCVGNIFSKKKS